MGIVISHGLGDGGQETGEGLASIGFGARLRRTDKQHEERYLLAKQQAIQEMDLAEQANERANARESRDAQGFEQGMAGRKELGEAFQQKPQDKASTDVKLAWIQGVAGKVAQLTGDPQHAMRFMDEAHKDLREQVSMEATERASAHIQRGLENGAFAYEAPSGAVDKSELAQSYMEMLQGAKTPEERLGIIKHLEDTMETIAQRKSDATVFKASLEDMGAKITQAQTGGRPDSMHGAVGVLSRMQAGAYTDTGSGKTDYNKAYGDLDDEIHGRKELKAQLEMLKLQNAQLTAEKTKADTEKSKTQGEMAGPWGKRLQAELDTNKAVTVEQEKAKLKSETPPRANSLGERSNAVARLYKILEGEFPDGKPADKRKVRESELRKDMGLEPVKGGPQKQGKDSAASVLEDIGSGKIDKAAAIKRAQALGFKSYDELKKAAK